MSIEEYLTAAGAECVAGDLILNREVVGQYRDGVFVATLAGHAAYEDMQRGKQAEVLQVVHEMSNIEVDVPELEPPVRRGRRSRSAE